MASTNVIVTTDGLASVKAYNGTVLAWLDTLKLDVYVNNHTPLVTDHLAAFTLATWGGYAQILANDWVDAGIDAANNYLYTWPDKVFTVTGAPLSQTAYGFVWQDAAGKACLAALAAASIAMDTAGKTYTVRADPGVALGQLVTPV
jgi:hypothetical protein